MESIVLSGGNYTARLDPSFGAQLYSLRWTRKGEALRILHEPESRQRMAEKPTNYGLPILFPPNRLDGGRFTVGGRTYQFPLNEPERGNSLHGFLHQRPWKLVSHTDSEAVMAFDIGPDADEAGREVYDLFPVTARVELTYRLSDEGLFQKVRVENRGEEAMPLGLGFHSSFEIDPQSRIQLSAGERVMLNDRMLPTGKVRELNQEEEALRGEGMDPLRRLMDDHYTAKPLKEDEEPWHSARISRFLPEGKNVTVRYRVNRFYRHWMVWNGFLDGHFICLEPQNWRVNAPNLYEEIGEKSGLDMVEAGGSKEALAVVDVL